MVRILIADDHFIVREGLKQIVSDVPDLVVVDEASDGQEALNKAVAGSFDIVILDISMPIKSGLDVLRELKLQKPDSNVLILSVHPEEHYAMRVLKAGASGYLTKESAPDELVMAIRRISQGRKYISTTLAEKLAGVIGHPADVPLHSTLSEREFRVMLMIASGYSIKKISEELFLSIKTVSTYRTRILKKMNFRNNSELIRYSIENGLGS
ncbi:MAG: response regulator transcription factor [Syntrophorhabdaceae bacterium]|nr:response regulator transcription factor [Syntrophorhabdaceae bacterium]